MARRIYQKKLSRDVAAKGKSCMEKIVGKEREEHTKEMANIINEVSTMGSEPENENDIDAIDQDNTIADVEEVMSIMSAASLSLKDETEMLQNEISVSTENLDPSTSQQTSTCTTTASKSLPSSSIIPEARTQDIDVEVKKEFAEDEVGPGRRRGSFNVGIQKRFSPEEDLVLKQGIEKHGLGKWSVMLKDESLQFHPSRARDSLRMRADTLGLTKRKRLTRKSKANNNAV